MSIRFANQIACLALLFVPLGMAACRYVPAVPRVPGRDEAITLEEVQREGDDRRRAATSLVAEGLAADDLGDPGRALDRYQLALKLDPGNPWAYLAIARQELDRKEPHRTLASLDRCRSLLESERNGFVSPRVETHLFGLRGAALEALGRFEEARPLLAEAQRRAPNAWADGYLTAGELR